MTHATVPSWMTSTTLGCEPLRIFVTSVTENPRPDSIADVPSVA